MGDSSASTQTASIILTTSIVTFISGFALGIYSSRGYLIPPSLKEERRRMTSDPIESEESDIDEDDTILDHAPNWSNGLDADRRDGLKVEGLTHRKGGKKVKGVEKPVDSAKNDSKDTSTPDVLGKDANEECKLVLVVRTDLGMTKGKIAAQCGHATLACYKTLSTAARLNPSSPAAKILSRWERLGQAKIAVQVKSEDEMMALMGVAQSLGVTAEVIADAGRTQIEAGSHTVLGIGPAPKSLVDRVTGGLKLL